MYGEAQRCPIVTSPETHQPRHLDDETLVQHVGESGAQRVPSVAIGEKHLAAPVVLPLQAQARRQRPCALVELEQAARLDDKPPPLNAMPIVNAALTNT